MRTPGTRPLARLAGITLVEMLAVMAILGLILPAVAAAFVSSLTYRQRSEAATADVVADMKLEETVRNLLATAILSSDVNDENTYFVLEQSTGSNTDLGYSLIFTRLSGPGQAAALESLEDFETQNSAYGPQGGIEEVSLSLTPAGQVGDVSGLFLRRQLPPDSDTLQGGRESLLDSDVQSIQFECYDGEAWQTVWDTRTSIRRLPSAVRVTYVLTQQPDVQRVFTVRLRLSDVTPDNPAVMSTEGNAP